jgi:Flp pilus assembly protein TadG
MPAITEPAGAPMARPVRNRREPERAATMVEFAMVAPLAFLLLLGIVVVGIAITHQMQLNQGVKNSARAVAICGVAAEQNPNNSPAGTLPNGNPCTAGSIQAYINGQMEAVSPGLAGEDTVEVYDSSGSGTAWTPSGPGPACAPGEVVQVTISYQQPLYLPLLGYVLGNGPSDTRQLAADGEATC